MSALSALGKGLFTAARIADAGLSLYQVTDEVWTMIDSDSRYPELRDLTNEMLEQGSAYDEKLNALIDQSNGLTNLSNGLNVINGTVRLLDDQGVSIFEHYEALAKQRESFALKYPTIRKWFDEGWIRQHNPNPKQYQQMADADKDFSFDNVLQYGFLTFGALITGYKIKSLITMGVDAYRRHRGVIQTRPRANAVVAPTSRIRRWGHNWRMFKARHPRMIKSLHVGALSASLGLNLYLIIDKARRISNQKDYLREQINTLKDNIRFVDALLNGTKDSRQLLNEVISHYKLEETDTNRDELKEGIIGLLKNYNENLDSCMTFINDTFDQLVDDAPTITDDEKDEINEIKSEHRKFSDLSDRINRQSDGGRRKELIVEASDLTRNTLVKRFKEWIEALSKILEIEKINGYLCEEASFIVEDLDGKQANSTAGKNMLKRKAPRLLRTLNSMYKDRVVYKTEADVLEVLTQLVEQLEHGALAA